MLQRAKTMSGKRKLGAAAGVLAVVLVSLVLVRTRQEVAAGQGLQVAAEKDILDLAAVYSKLADSFYATDNLACLLDSYPKLEGDEQTRVDGLVQALAQDPFRCASGGDDTMVLRCNAVALVQADARKRSNAVVQQYHGVVSLERLQELCPIASITAQFDAQETLVECLVGKQEQWSADEKRLQETHLPQLGNYVFDLCSQLGVEVAGPTGALPTSMCMRDCA